MIRKIDAGFTLEMTSAEANVLASLLGQVGGDAENDFLFRTFEALKAYGVPGDLAVEAESNAENQEFFEDYGGPSHRLVL